MASPGPPRLIHTRLTAALCGPREDPLGKEPAREHFSCLHLFVGVSAELSPGCWCPGAGSGARHTLRFRTGPRRCFCGSSSGLLRQEVQGWDPGAGFYSKSFQGVLAINTGGLTVPCDYN